jgi:uncharacterized membrane protein
MSPSAHSGSSHSSGGGGFGGGPHGLHGGGISYNQVIVRIVIFAFASLFLLIAGLVTIESCDKSMDNKSVNTSASTDILTENSEIYVKEIGRTCNWDSEYECYYDQTTECYFWKNDTINPPQWQYWFEGISSDYGDYGCMEYDFELGIWYIEVSAGKWEPLPGKYYSTDLWHFSSV